MTSILQDVEDYERWLRKRCDVVEADLNAKHKRMRESAFDFLRASYFRWCNTVEDLLPGILDAPKVLCVGDIHVENYGTWRDADGRLVWGINDFDEAAPMPYALDLIRLAVSACLVPDLPLGAGVVCRSLRDGYLQGLSSPRPLLLDEHDPWLRALVLGSPDAPAKFWDEMDACPDAKPPQDVRRALNKALPDGAAVERFASRKKGGGSLGRPRYLAMGHWQGGRVVREAKAVVPSAWYWAHKGLKASNDSLKLARGRFRSYDPSMAVKSGFALRRIAPDAMKIDLSDIADEGVSQRLLLAMGAELGAVHASHRNRSSVLRHANGQSSGVLLKSVQAALRQVTDDYEAYAGATSGKSRSTRSRR